MPSKEVITFWLDTGAPISLLSNFSGTDAIAPLDFRTRRQASVIGCDGQGPGLARSGRCHEPDRPVLREDVGDGVRLLGFFA